MKIYNLPEDKDFSSDILNDLIRAKNVMLISPFLSINVIKEWRELFKNGSSENFTIVYDIDETSAGKEKGLHGKSDDELIKLISWRNCEKLHSKIYYFEFEKGYSFYHGSANLTNFGVGNKVNGNEMNRNREIMSRITGDTTTNKNIQNIIKYYNENSKAAIPRFDNKRKIWISELIENPIDEIGIIKEYKDLLVRLGLNKKYKNAKSKYILKKINNSNLSKVKGIRKTGNHKIIKFHTTNVKGDKAEFTISREELEWFTGKFLKSDSQTRSRKLYLVWKLDGTFEGRLIVFILYPINIFDLLKESNRSKKFYYPYKSLTLSITNVEGEYILKRYNSSVIIPTEQVKTLPPKKVEV